MLTTAVLTFFFFAPITLPLSALAAWAVLRRTTTASEGPSREYITVRGGYYGQRRRGGSEVSVSDVSLRSVWTLPDSCREHAASADRAQTGPFPPQWRARPHDAEYIAAAAAHALAALHAGKCASRPSSATSTASRILTSQLRQPLRQLPLD